MFKHLEWDSNFFGFPTALLTGDRYSYSKLDKSLSQLKDSGYKLVYMFTYVSDWVTYENAIKAGGNHLDQKVTFTMNLSVPNRYANDPHIMIFPEQVPGNDMIQLALDSGKYSRFRQDSKISEDTFIELYKQWIINSCLRKIADEVFIYKKRELVKGFVTVAMDGSKGKIGLIAVNSEHKGTGIGRILMNCVNNYCLEKSLKTIEVVTQNANQDACAFYKQLGFTIKNVKNAFHFWL